VAIVYLAPGLENDTPAIATALNGLDVLSVGASGAHAKQGAVVAFDLEEGKPKIVVNLGQAKSQHVALRSEVLSLARIVGN
ncbi:YfiR family protein, partial [Acinetobacter baumannii]